MPGMADANPAFGTKRWPDSALDESGGFQRRPARQSLGALGC